MRACIQFQSITENKALTYYFQNPVKVIRGNIDSLSNIEKNYYTVCQTTYEGDTVLYMFDAPVRAFEVGEHSPLLFAFTETKEEIINKINDIQDAIRHGDTYQVNYTTRLVAEGDGDAFQLYKLLSKHNGGYTAFIEDGDEAVISISPELFFEKNDSHIITRPMKGTIPRSTDPIEDENNKKWLETSHKDQAENVMIVDLLRNDLSRIATKISVEVTSLFTIEAYDTVYQMTSTIEAHTQEQLSTCFNALFPCGSITGAPKKSTMALIESLEVDKRGIYCGAIGFIHQDLAIFNVPIRTIKKVGTTYTYGVGGGITINSDPYLEFEEMLAKTKVLNQLKPKKQMLEKDFHLIETMNIGKSGVQRKKLHLERIKRSIQHFNMSLHWPLIEKLLNMTTTKNKILRLAIYETYVSYTLKELDDTISTFELLPMKQTEDDYVLYKTSQRDHYKTNLHHALYYNQEGMLTEFNIGNFVYQEDNQYFTPNEKVLPGCMRQSLLENGIIQYKDLHVDNLKDVDAIYMVNSLREWVEMTHVMT